MVLVLVIENILYIQCELPDISTQQNPEVQIIHGINITLQERRLAATMYRDVQVSREGRMPEVTDAGVAPAT